MAKRRAGVVRQFGRLYSLGAVGGVTDAQLLVRFLARQDAGAEVAFEVLVERHGPMVLRVCRSVLRDEHAAEDAFQATFFVLARKARSLWVKDSLGNWLHGVARRVASRARSDTVRRRRHERQSAEHVGATVRTEATADGFHFDEADVLCDEIAQLPDKYHAPIVLCYLESMSYEDAASRLGLTEDALRGRLARGRERLRSRLTRRGFQASAVLASSGTGMQAPAVMPFGLLQSTVQAALNVSARHELGGGVISQVAISLSDRICRTMFRTKLSAAALLFFVGTLVAGVAALDGRGAHALHETGSGPHKVVVTSPTARDVTVTERFVCQIHARRHIELIAPANGYLEKILVKEGQPVKQGALMFKIVPVLDEAKGKARLAQPQVAQPQVKKTDKKLADDPVVPKNGVRPPEPKRARGEAKANPPDAELEATTVKAPFDGIIDRVQEQQGSLIKEGDSLTTLSDNSVMWVYFNVPTTWYLKYMATVKEHADDRRIELELANQKKFQQTGKIGAIASTVDNQTGNIAFRADFPNPDRMLRHGQTGTVLIHRVLKGAIVIPQPATFEILGKRYVFAVDKNNVVHQRAIVVQNEADNHFVIEKGLDLSDRIILDDIQQVRDGEKVECEFRQSAEVTGKPQKNGHSATP